MPNPNGIMTTLQQLKQLIEASSDAELKSQAAALIATAETEATGLTDEKARLLSKRDELLGKLKKFQKFEAHTDVDIDEWVRIKALYESQDSDQRSKYESLYNADKQKLESRLAAIEKE